MSCGPSPGSTFAIGTTAVTCSASDSDDTPDSASTSFTVTVLGAPDQLGQLGAAVAGVGPGGSLSSKIQSALADLAAGVSTGADGVLTGFVNEVRAQTGKKISQAQAAQLIAAAQQIQAVIG